jgi:hypothetical protein
MTVRFDRPLTAPTMKHRIVNYGTLCYLVVEDSDGADASLLMNEGESPADCLARHIEEEQRKRDIFIRRINRMRSWAEKLPA